MKVETELLNQITRLVISLVVVLQITPWVLLLLGFFIMRHLDRRSQSHAPSATSRTTERR